MAKQKKANVKGAGAKEKYVTLRIEARLPEIEGWARDGLRESDIAAKLGITRQTLCVWKKKHPEFSEAIYRGKEVIDAQVENKLLNNAYGYDYWEETQEMRYNPATGQDEMMTVKRVLKHIKPETVAQIFWLKNRKPKEWRDKQEIKHEGAVSLTFVDDLDE